MSQQIGRSHDIHELRVNDPAAEVGETLGLDLEFESQEKRVGLFRADIIARDTADGSLVLIENQLERTD
ncbi:MAG: hypothetical protein QGH33_12680, partial [Pirellulaceae bacterium]|nr:hypothetical protein [Pirellulaceae bacterium]